jgi:hypothetical protein
MLNSITNHSLTYAMHSATDTMPKVPPSLLKETEQKNTGPKEAGLDVYQRTDGSTATRRDLETQHSVGQSEAAVVVDANEKKFRELLHQFIGQTLFGQMLKAMRATQEKNPYFHGGQSEEIYQSLLDMELTDQMTQSTSKTLSEPMYKLMRAPRMQ